MAQISIILSDEEKDKNSKNCYLKRGSYFKVDTFLAGSHETKTIFPRAAHQ